MKKLIKNLVMLFLGILSLVFLFNPGFGVFLEIPDNLPFIGNLDEAAAATLLISVLAYFGLDVTRVFRGFRKADPEVADRKGRVIDADEVPPKDA